MIIVCLILFFLLCIIFTNFYNPEPFVNSKLVSASVSEYPCRVVLTDEEFLKHMIPHHQMAIDISIQHSQNTKSDIIMKIMRELIWTQKYEVLLMRAELKRKTENMSVIVSNQPLITTISSNMYPNVMGLTDAYCDPAFFTYKKNQHTQHHTEGHKIVTDRQYIVHMIPHHQVAIDMCKILLQNTKSDFLIFLAYRMIRAQEAEIILLNDLLQSPFFIK
jgi:uncharacterized protein (DUF305 family)